MNTFNRAEYDRLVTFQARERDKAAAAKLAITERRRQRYEAVYAATFARLHRLRPDVARFAAGQAASAAVAEMES